MARTAREHRGVRTWLVPLMAVALLLPGRALAGQEDLHVDQDSLAKALKKGQATEDLRYRLETVADDFPAVADDDATASTLRTTLAYRTSRWQGLSAYVQFEDVSNLGASDLRESQLGLRPSRRVDP